MSLYDDIKKRIVECMKSGESEERDILKTLIGEIQSKITREGKSDISDALVEKTLLSFRESSYECTIEGIQKKVGIETKIIVLPEIEAKAKREIAVYEKFIPQYEDLGFILRTLNAYSDRLIDAKSTGVATGIALGILKKDNKKVHGKDVAKAVQTIREHTQLI